MKSNSPLAKFIKVKYKGKNIQKLIHQGNILWTNPETNPIQVYNKYKGDDING